MNDSLPYFPFYVRDFTADGKVEAMTTEQVGAYILLLSKAWHETPPCSLPNDDTLLARWARVKPSAWMKMRSGVMVCWTLDEPSGRYFQKRLKAEYDRLLESRDRRSKAGRNGNAKRWGGDHAAIALRSHAGMSLTLDLPEGGPGETGDAAKPRWLSLADTLWPKCFPTPELRAEWVIALADHPAEAIEKAMREQAAATHFTPVLADITKRLPKRKAANIDDYAAKHAQRLENDKQRRTRKAGAA